MKFFLATITAALASLALAVDPVADAVADAIVNAGDAEPTVITSVGTLTRWPPPPPPTRTSTTTSSSTFIITVTTLPPGKPTVIPRPCPTVTLTTRPSGCEPIRCPIPGCTYEQDMIIPCGCDVKTLLWVEGCQTACPVGCATRTNTLSQLCGTATATQATDPSAVVISREPGTKIFPSASPVPDRLRVLCACFKWPQLLEDSFSAPLDASTCGHSCCQPGTAFDLSEDCLTLNGQSCYDPTASRSRASLPARSRLRCSQLHAFGGRGDDGLFRAAILGSGGTVGVALFDDLVWIVGCAGAADLLACIRGIPADELFAARGGTAWSLLVDGFPTTITNDTLFPQNGLQWRRSSAIYVDIVMIAERRKLSAQYAAAIQQVYSYRFATRPWGTPEAADGAQHFVNVAFSFRNITSTPDPLPEFQSHRDIGADISKAYLNFVY
ncbi:hypothetical protein F4859DRAFT_509921 [Xylaria cf. heliscus]|nr:hypothetical protein F4859DRAFT_509921 [Xylaria cf. heliscus]